ncbi:MAG: hypothetical protein AAF628_27580 [Planctomycetota bacterium]
MHLTKAIYSHTVAVIALSASLVSLPQQPQAGSPARDALDQPIPVDAFSVPIHTGQGDKGVDYGIWASGPDYKVSFHDGMTFYPVLGAAAPRNLPVRWVTTSVRVGERELAGDAPRSSFTDWRFEYRHDGLTEAYDVRADGVEQTFVLQRRPDGVGDLVIRGRLETELRADRSPAKVGDLVLRDDRGNAVVRYGQALAFDDAGRTRDVTSQFDGEDVELRLSQDFLANATYPLTVDPLLSSALVAPGGNRVLDVSIGRNDSEDELMVAFIRTVSSGDNDVYVHLMKDNWAFATPVFTDITSQWWHRSIDVAYVAGAQSWVAAYNRVLGGSQEIRVHYHDGGDFSMSSVLQFLTTADYANDISVGGSSDPSSTAALIAYRKDVGRANTSQSEIRAIAIDAATRARLNEFLVSGEGSIPDAENCQVNERRRLSGFPWFVTYQEADHYYAAPDWRVYIARVYEDGRAQRAELGDPGFAVHDLAPHIDASHDRALVAFHQMPNTSALPANFAKNVWTQRVDWPLSSAQPTIHGPKELVRLTENVQLGGVAFDTLTKSHWTIVAGQITGTPLLRVWRVGHDGRSVEGELIGGAASYQYAAVTFDDDAKEFSIAFNAGGNVLGTKMAYHSGVRATVSGTGCGPATMGPRGTSHSYLPWSGTANFGVVLNNAPSGTAAVLLFSGGQAAVSLASLGLPNCTLLVDPARIVGAINVQLASTFYDLPVRIPSAVSGGVNLQWAYFDPTAPGGLSLTERLTLFIK